jgi:hypothetical protein
MQRRGAGGVNDIMELAYSPRLLRSSTWPVCTIAMCLGACQLEAPTQTRTSEPERRPVMKRVIDAGVHAVASDLEEVPDPGPWIFRDTMVGITVYPRRETSILRRDEDRASLRVISEPAD